MGKVIFPSSFKCDCCHESHFFEKTVWEMEEISKKKRVRLGGDGGHTIVFHKGKAIEII